MESEKLEIAVLDTHEKADSALKTLKTQGFDTSKISVIGREHYSDKEMIASYSIASKAVYHGGSFLMDLPANFYGKGLMAIPGIGPFGMSGPFVAWLDEELVDSNGEKGFGVIAKVLSRFGVSKENADIYQQDLKDGKYLLMITGNVSELSKASGILEAFNAKAAKYPA